MYQPFLCAVFFFVFCFFCDFLSVFFVLCTMLPSLFFFLFFEPPPSPGPPSPDPRPKFRSLFFPLPLPFFFSREVFSLNHGGRLEPWTSYFVRLGSLVVKPRRPLYGREPRPQFHEKAPKEREEKMNFAAALSPQDDGTAGCPYLMTQNPSWAELAERAGGQQRSHLWCAGKLSACAKESRVCGRS